MGIAERRAREKDELRQKILAAASELFVENGFDNVSMRKVADKIEYAASTIYLYFKNKNELIAGICADAFEALNDRLEEIERRELPALDAFLAGVRCYIAFGLENPHQYRLVFSNPVPEQFDEEFKDVNALGLQALDHLARSIEKCRQAGVFTETDPRIDAYVIWMILHGVTSVIITDHGRHHMPWPSQETLIDRALQMVLSGCGLKR
jgi:AcrR family transcriptional regulator